jgi:hypothetical protein
MTQEEFILTAKSAPYQINVWIKEQDPPGSPPFIVQGLSIPVLDVNNVNVEDILQQLEYVTLPTDESEVVTLDIENSSIHYSDGYTFYFYPVVNLTITTLGDKFVQTGSVIFTPGLSDINFSTSPYNVLYGNAETPQQSSYIYQAGSSTKAYIQDSLLSDTGWKNARYEGTKTSAETYTGQDPAIAGNVFEGIAYSSQLTDGLVLSQSISTPLYINYFHTGKEELPTYNLLQTPSYLLVEDLFPTSSRIVVELTYFDITANRIQVGDLVRIATGSSTPQFLPEVMKVLNIVPTITAGVVYLDVKRGWSGTQIHTGNYGQSKGVYKIEPVKVYELRGNKIQGVTKGKVIVRGTEDILYIDPTGLVYTGSFS